MAEYFHVHFTPDIQPPNFTDLDLLNFYVWGVFAMESHKPGYNDWLKSALESTMPSVDKMNSCNNFGSRIESIDALIDERFFFFKYNQHSTI